MKVTLAKALKLKNRLVNKLGQVRGEIQGHNSVIKGNDRLVDIEVALQRADKLQDAVVNVKSAISAANQPIQQVIYLIAELKGEICFWQSINTQEGQTVKAGGWGTDDTIVEREAVINHQQVVSMVENLELNIDNNQDVIDKHNHNTEIEIDEAVFDLLKG